MSLLLWNSRKCKGCQFLCLFYVTIKDKLPDFRKGYFTGSLKPEEYHDYGPVELFCSSFRKNWKQALDIIAEERKSL